MHSTGECYMYMEVLFHPVKVTQGYMCTKAHSSLSQRHWLLLHYYLAHLCLSFSLFISLLLSSPSQLRPDCLFCLVKHFLPKNPPFLTITFSFLWHLELPSSAYWGSALLAPFSNLKKQQQQPPIVSRVWQHIRPNSIFLHSLVI